MRLYKGMILISLFLLILSLSKVKAELSVDFEAIKQIESGGSACAFNQETKCYGLYQISEICLMDYNQFHKAVYQTMDLYDPKVNKEVACWYFSRIKQMLLRFNIPVNITTLIASYNWGIGNVVGWFRNGANTGELPQETKNYIDKYQRLTLK